MPDGYCNLERGSMLYKVICRLYYILLYDWNKNKTLVFTCFARVQVLIRWSVVKYSITVLLEIGNMFNSSLALIFDRPGRDGYPFHHGCSVVELQWINKGVGHILCKQVGGCSCWHLQNSSEWQRNNCSCLHTGHHAVIPCFDRCLLSRTKSHRQGT